MSLVRGGFGALRMPSGSAPKLTISPTGAPLAPTTLVAQKVSEALATIPPRIFPPMPDLTNPLTRGGGVTAGGIPISTGGNLIGGRSGAWVHSMTPVAPVASTPPTPPLSSIFGGSTFSPFASQLSQPAVTQSLPSIGPTGGGGGSGGTMLDDHDFDPFAGDAAAKAAALAEAAEADAKRKRWIIFGGIGAAVIVGFLVLR